MDKRRTLYHEDLKIPDFYLNLRLCSAFNCCWSTSSIDWLYVVCKRSLCPAYVPYILSTPALHLLYTLSTPALYLLYTLSTPAIHPLYTRYTPSLYPLYTRYTPALHTVWPRMLCKQGNTRLGGGREGKKSRKIESEEREQERGRIKHSDKTRTLEK